MVWQMYSHVSVVAKNKESANQRRTAQLPVTQFHIQQTAENGGEITMKLKPNFRVIFKLLR
jgi:hypothetical protein